MIRKLIAFTIGLVLIAGVFSLAISIVTSVIGFFVILFAASIIIRLFKELVVVIYKAKNRKPLTYEQAIKLSKGYANYYFKNTYRFKKENVSVDVSFKSALDKYGTWYEIEEPISTFPSYIAKLLQGKHHEWVVVGIECDQVVKYMWVNKGPDNQSVSINCDLNDIVKIATDVGGYTVLRLHNHPNPDPKKYTTLLASEQDKISAASCSEYVNKFGLNWIDFVCSRGEFIKYYSSQSNTFEAHNYTTSDIIDRSNITKEMDSDLQGDYLRYCGMKGLNLTWVSVVLGIVCIVIFGSVYKGKSVVPNPIQTIDINEISLEGIGEDEIIQALNNVDGVIGIEAATKATDINNLLYDKCSSVVFFSYDEIELTDSQKQMTIVEIGTDAGGCVEVFISEEEAVSRMKKLNSLSLLAGGGHRYGKVIIRTSAKLSKKQQNELQNKVLIELSQYAPETYSLATDDWYTAMLNDFEYIIDKGTIILNKYIGESNSVIVPSSYLVENANLPVQVGNVFENTKVINVLLSEGIKRIDHKSFSGATNLKHLYIPSSIEYIGDLCKYIPAGEILYYGSSEQNWKKINNVQSSSISFKRIEFNSTIEDCIENKDIFINVVDGFIGEEYTSLDKFSYDIEDNALVLTDYKGKEKFVRVSSVYYVNGIEIPVKELNNTFTLGSVSMVIVPEGVTTVSGPLFNSCGVKKVYLPSTLVNVPSNFWGYFHKLDTLYFGGTEEEFNQLLSNKSRWDIDVQHMEYNCNPNELVEE